MIDRKKVIKAIETHLSTDISVGCDDCTYENDGWCTTRLLADILALLKEQEAVEPHYTTLRYLVNGMEVAIQHPECPRCIENGLVLWDAEIEKGQAYCKRCGQKVKWE